MVAPNAYEEASVRELAAAATDSVFSAEAGHSFQGWQKTVSRSFLPLRLSAFKPAAFRGRLRAAGCETLHVSDISASGHAVERTPGLIADAGAEYFKLSFQISGTGLMVQGDRELVLRPGDMTIYDTSRPYSLVFDDDFRFLVAMFPRKAVQFRRQDVEELSAVRMDGTTGVGNLVSSFLTGLSANLDNLSAPTGSRLSQIGLDLIATLVDDQLGEVQTKSTAALKRQIYSFMNEHLSDPDLSPAVIADANFISVRYLHTLFQEEGSTVAAWIRQQRLERCRQDLHDPACAHLSVSDIAGRWGMHDAGHFSKLFRSQYQQTPSTWRAAAQR
jgi:AraC-like DNA-binding protein